MELPEIGEVFQSKYRLESVLGEGGFARVFYAEDVGARRYVALKVLKPLDSAGYAPDIVSRFQREVRVVANLRDPHTVTMFDFGTTDEGLMFMVFEYIPGTDLSKLLKERKKLAESETVHILEQVMRSLREAHHAGLLHRDIKPENIRIYEYMGDPLRVSLLDFGIAKPVKPGSDVSAITSAGALVGTPKYMSPEQLLDQELTPASDIYSLGLVAYEMLTGESAIGGNALSDQLRVLGSGESLRLPATERVSPAMRRIVDRMISREPGTRLQSAQQVLQELQQLSGSELTGSQPMLAPPRPPISDTLLPPSGSGPMRPATGPTQAPPPTSERARVPSYAGAQHASGPAATPHSSAVYPPAGAGSGPISPTETVMQDEPLSNSWLIGLMVALLVFVAVIGVVVAKLAAGPEESQPVKLPEVYATTAAAEPIAEPVAVVAQPVVIDAGSAAPEPEHGGCGRNVDVRGRGSLFVRDGLVQSEYSVFVPKGYDPAVEYPLLVLFFDAGQTTHGIFSETGFDRFAEKHNFLIFVPQDGDLAPWNDASDLVRASDQIEELKDQLCIDDDRIFAFGHGAGGRAAERMPCYSDRIDATATTSYRPPPDEPAACAPANAVAHLHIATLRDGHSPPDGAVGCNGESNISVAKQEELWRGRNRCESKRKIWQKHKFGNCYSWSCEAPFVSCGVEGGRGWPGPGGGGYDIGQCNGTPAKYPFADTIWKFFMESAPKPEETQ